MSFVRHCDVPCHDTFTTSNMMKAVAISVWSIRVDYSDTAVVDAEGKWVEGGHGDRCPCAFPTGFSAVMVSFRLRGISLQKEADSVGCIILLPCDVAELFFPLVIAIHCLLFIVTEGAGLPNSFSWWHLGQIDMRGQCLVDAWRNPRCSSTGCSGSCKMSWTMW